MGVPKFYNVWLKNQDFKGALRRGAPGLVSSLSIDMNGVFHQVAQQVYAYGDGANPTRVALVKRTSASQLEAELFNGIAVKLLELIEAIKPIDTLALAVDGVAPQAKIAQQRSRRFRSVQGRLPDNSFDSNAITPGTEFMMRLDLYLQRWIDSNKLALPPRVIYSSHMVDGEGEHKIMQYFRRGEILGTESHVIHGMDADLIMLSMLLPIQKIYLWREDIRTTISIDNLKTGLMTRMKMQSSITDFVLMMFLLGNDFLPHHPALSDFAISIDLMLTIYEQMGKSLTTIDGEIDWTNFLILIVSLANAEPQVMEQEANRNFLYPSRMITYDNQTTQQYGGGTATPTLNIKTTKVFDFTAFRSAWYSNAFSPKGDVSLITKIMGSNPFGPSVEGITSLSEQYLRGIAWTYAYYHGGMRSVNISWYFNQYYAPLFTDLAPSLDSFIKGTGITGWQFDPEKLPLNPVHQLLAVLPPASRDLLPQEVQFLSTKDSPIADYYPIDFIVERDGIMAEWQGIVILPFVEPRRIIDAVNQLVRFTPERAALFSGVTDLVIERTKDVQDLLQSKQRVAAFLQQERGRGRGRGRGIRGRGGRGRGEFLRDPRIPSVGVSEGRGRGRGEGRGRGRGEGRGSRGRGVGGVGSVGGGGRGTQIFVPKGGLTATGRLQLQQTQPQPQPQQTQTQKVQQWAVKTALI